MSPQLQELFNASIAINSTAFEDADPETGEVVFVGSKTEAALLKFAKELGWVDYKKTRDAASVVQMIPFSSERKAMGVVVKLMNGRARLYLKGASEILSKKCTRHVIISKDASYRGGPDQEVETTEIDELASDNISRTIIFYANQTLHCALLSGLRLMATAWRRNFFRGRGMSTSRLVSWVLMWFLCRLNMIILLVI